VTGYGRGVVVGEHDARVLAQRQVEWLDLHPLAALDHHVVPPLVLHLPTPPTPPPTTNHAHGHGHGHGHGHAHGHAHERSSLWSVGGRSVLGGYVYSHSGSCAYPRVDEAAHAVELRLGLQPGDDDACFLEQLRVREGERHRLGVPTAIELHLVAHLASVRRFGVVVPEHLPRGAPAHQTIDRVSNACGTGCTLSGLKGAVESRVFSTRLQRGPPACRSCP
jgi:hypothetical protein